MELKDFRPQAKLVTRRTMVDRPRFPVIDAHNHLAEPFGGSWGKRPLPDDLLRRVSPKNAVKVLKF